MSATIWWLAPVMSAVSIPRRGPQHRRDLAPDRRRFSGRAQERQARWVQIDAPTDGARTEMTR
jgi:hypothetical protein